MWTYRCYDDGRKPNLWQRWYDSSPDFQGSHDSIFEMLESRVNWGPPHAKFLDSENRIIEVRLTGKVKHRILGFYGDTRGEFIVLGTCFHKQNATRLQILSRLSSIERMRFREIKKGPSPVPDQNDLAKFDRKAYRDGYLQAKVRGMIAYQIQALREKTGLNQTDFAEKIGKTQSVVSRLEDTEYGRVSVQTLLDIACRLDVALLVKFASYPDFLFQTRDLSATALQPQTIYESLAQPARPEQQKPLGGAAARAAASDQNYSTKLYEFDGMNDNAPMMSAKAFSEIRAQA
jgi:transcriptional regulator with XRE-family HTH domain